MDENFPPPDAAARMLSEKKAAVAEGLEQDLSKASLDDAIAAMSSAQFEPACLQPESGNPNRLGGTDCTVRESSSSALGASASDNPAGTSVDVWDAYVSSAEVQAAQVSQMTELNQKAVAQGASQGILSLALS